MNAMFGSKFPPVDLNRLATFHTPPDEFGVCFKNEGMKTPLGQVKRGTQTCQAGSDHYNFDVNHWQPR